MTHPLPVPLAERPSAELRDRLATLNAIPLTRIAAAERAAIVRELLTREEA